MTTILPNANTGLSRLVYTVGRWFSWSAGALGENIGQQSGQPSGALISGTRVLSTDGALQIAALWGCIERRANVVASLPFFAYKQREDGQKTLARTSRLYALLHDSPNSRMTPFEFWRAMMMNHDLRGNAYARIDRADPAEGQSIGEAQALWPMPADQVRPVVLADGSMVYEYVIGGQTAILAEENVLHLKNLGNGTVGLAKLEYMASTTVEMTKAQEAASKVFGNGGKPTAILMIDTPTLTKTQRDGLKSQYGELASGSTSRLAVLEANMKYQQLSMSPEEQQLFEARGMGVEEICRWMDVPPVLMHRANVTTWGSGIEQIVDGWYKLSVRPILVSIEQAVRKRVMTPRQRAGMVAEFNLDALLRGNIKDRYEVYAKAVQNGLKSRNETRQLENDPPVPGGDVLTVQSNLLPIDMLGKVTPPASGGSGDNLAQ
jgi:HK97 family phage portal protein